MYPIIFQSKFFTLYSYPFFWGVAWALAYFTSEKYVLMHAPQDYKFFKFYVIGIFLSVWAGAKGLFILTQTKLQSVLMQNESFWFGGGFVFYGGLFGGVFFAMLSYVIIKKFYKEHRWTFIESFVPGLILGHGVGRLGCWFAGCCFGKKFPGNFSMLGLEQYPVQLLESVFLVSLYFSLKNLFSKQLSRGVFCYFLLYGVFRFCIEFLRGDKARGFIGIWSTSQALSVVTVCFAFLYFYYVLKNQISIKG